MIKPLKILLLSTFSILFLSCNGVQSPALSEQGDTISFRYAEHITAVRYADRTVVTLSDPWQEGRILHTYILVSDSNAEHFKSNSSKYQEEGTVVRVPLRRSIVFNTAHASLLHMLGATSAICGVCDLRYMQLPDVLKRTKLAATDKDYIADCGDGMAPDVERIIDLKADALLLSPFEGSDGHGVLSNINIPLIECADYMETSALGRAEWMKFYGMLFGCEREADSLFHVVDSCYHSFRKVAQEAAQHRKASGQELPSVLTERLTSGTWYVPGGQSSMSKLIQDAGARYAWAADKHSGSLALTFESVLDKASDATLWVFNYIGQEPLTYKGLVAEHNGYAQFRAFREHRVWYVNSLRVPYFEQVSFRPDWLLRDYIAMLFPELNMENPKYFTPLTVGANE